MAEGSSDPTGRSDITTTRSSGGGGGGLPSFQGGGHTSGAEAVTEPFLSPNDPSMPRGTLVLRGMVSASREDGFEAGGFVFDAAVCVRDGQAPYVIGAPTIVKYVGAITPGIDFALAIQDDNLCGVFTGSGGAEIDWTISGQWTGNFGGGGGGG